MEYTRQYVRYPTQREAFYCMYEQMSHKHECTIINISRKGMGVVFNRRNGIQIGVPIRIEIPIATALESIIVSGMVKWIDDTESSCLGGIELSKELSDVKFSKQC